MTALTGGPLWVTNLKNYELTTGEALHRLMAAHDAAQAETGAEIMVAGSVLDVAMLAAQYETPVLSQHADPLGWGKHTGHVVLPKLAAVGARGTLLNHSERRMNPAVIAETVRQAEAEGLLTIVCAESPAEVEQLAALKPSMIAYEPPELIGSTGASVASAKPESIAESVRLAGGIPLLVGAGVSRVEDVEVSLELGARGFLVATAVVKATDPLEKLKEFVGAF